MTEAEFLEGVFGIPMWEIREKYPNMSFDSFFDDEEEEEEEDEALNNP